MSTASYSSYSSFLSGMANINGRHPKEKSFIFACPVPLKIGKNFHWKHFPLLRSTHRELEEKMFVLTDLSPPTKNEKPGEEEDASTAVDAEEERKHENHWGFTFRDEIYTFKKEIRDLFWRRTNDSLETADSQREGRIHEMDMPREQLLIDRREQQVFPPFASSSSPSSSSCSFSTFGLPNPTCSLSSVTSSICPSSQKTRQFSQFMPRTSRWLSSERDKIHQPNPNMFAHSGTNNSEFMELISDVMVSDLLNEQFKVFVQISNLWLGKDFSLRLVFKIEDHTHSRFIFDHLSRVVNKSFLKEERSCDNMKIDLFECFDKKRFQYLWNRERPSVLNEMMFLMTRLKLIFGINLCFENWWFFEPTNEKTFVKVFEKRFFQKIVFPKQKQQDISNCETHLTNSSKEGEDKEKEDDDKKKKQAKTTNEKKTSGKKLDWKKFSIETTEENQIPDVSGSEKNERDEKKDPAVFFINHLSSDIECDETGSNEIDGQFGKRENDARNEKEHPLTPPLPRMTHCASNSTESREIMKENQRGHSPRTDESEKPERHRSSILDDLASCRKKAIERMINIPKIDQNGHFMGVRCGSRRQFSGSV